MVAKAEGRRPRRWSKRSLRIMAWAVGAIGFAVPWGVLRAVPRAAQPAAQVVVVPAGSQVVIRQGSGGKAGVTVLAAPGAKAATAAPATTTGGSHPVP